MPVCLKERNRTKKQQGWEELLVATSKHHVTWKRRTWIFLACFGGRQECWNPIPYLCFFVWSFAEFGLLTLSSLSSSSPNKRVKRFGKLWQENMLIILRIGWCFFLHACISFCIFGQVDYIRHKSFAARVTLHVQVIPCICNRAKGFLLLVREIKFHL